MYRLSVDQTFATSIVLLSDVAVLIGRDASCHLQLQDSSASRVHCRIIEHDGRVRLYDAGSRWGTFVNGQRVTERDLQVGDRIQIGAIVLQLSRACNADNENRTATSSTIAGQFFDREATVASKPSKVQPRDPVALM